MFIMVPSGTAGNFIVPYETTSSIEWNKLILLKLYFYSPACLHELENNWQKNYVSSEGVAKLSQHDYPAGFL